MTDDKAQITKRILGNRTPHCHHEAPFPSVIARLANPAEAISVDGTGVCRILINQDWQ